MSEHQDPSRPLILASTSRYRRELFSRLALEYEAVDPKLEEDVDPRLDPLEQIRLFARQKAEAVRALGRTKALIIGSDQGVILAGQLLGKPGTAEKAEAQLAALSGGTHLLATAVCVLDAASGQIEEATDSSWLHFRTLSPAAIRRYVALDSPLDCAGSFKLESLGIALFEKLEGSDYTGIMGLPLITLVELLSRFGVSPL
ncbi:MAG: septum formation protein Maf [Deltaproteobacteria bacterium CG2_30_63_29]|nr:MAG: septum formation protein Maf [Deltaproteobacteria bacterium CG2_30_63_29]PJB48345.1 MAG: septum formation protein Maf [Deltaproteobacteria bacterium CG_4_9_14_3_um_filter_63_12]